MTGFRKLCAKEDNVPPAPARWGTTPQPANGKTPTANELQGMATMFGLEVNDWAALSWLVVTCIAAYGDGTTPTPPDDGELPEEVATLIPWLLEEAAQAANAGHSTTADLLTLAARLLGERVARAQSALLLEPMVGPAAPSDEEWEALKERLWDQYQVVLELRDRIIHLEQQHETAKACILEIYERLDKLKDDHESNWARIVKLEEARGSDTLAALEQRVKSLEPLPPRVGHILRLAEIIREVDGNHDKGAAALAEAILSHPGIAEVLPHAPATTPAADDAEEMTLHTIALRMVDSLRWLGVLPEILDTLRRAIRQPMAPAAEPAPHRQLPGPQQIAECGGPCESIGPEACDCGQFPPLPAPAGALVDQIDTDLRKAFRKSVRSGVIDPLPEQRQNFLCLVLAIMQTESAEQAAYAAVSVIAQWLERHHTGRIANGSQFASLLREMLDREAGR